MTGHLFAQECIVDAECDDGLWCTGSEACVSDACVPGIPPCDDSNPCTTDPCDEDNDICLDKGCAGISPADPCCNDPVCEGAGLCVAKVTLKPGNAWATPGEVLKKPVCLDNPHDLVGGIQFDLCEYLDGQPSDCETCIDCELTDRTVLFDCAVVELANGCCRVIVFSTQPGGVINPGLCDMVTVVYELHQDCLAPICIVQIPQDIVVSDNAGLQLPASGLPGEVCFLSADTDGDGVPDEDDNCLLTPNGPNGGTCTSGGIGDYCMSDGDCGIGGFCSLNQEDTDGDGIGDACECSVDADCDDGLYCNGPETCVNGICQPGTDPCQPLFCNEEGDTCNPVCVTDADCDDGLWCTGAEICVSDACVSGISPCDDSNPCTTDPCDEDNDICLVKGCAAISPPDLCCSDPVCEGSGLCVAKVVLKTGDVEAIPGEVLKKPVCLENTNDLVGGIQFDLCEYSDGQPIDCMSCIDCELTERTVLFDCVVNELANGCCRVILFSTHPTGVINPGLCDIVTVVYELHGNCLAPTCTVQIPQNIVASDDAGFRLPAFGLSGEVCFLPADTDGDGVSDDDDNCPLTPNGPDGGTCTGNVRNSCISNQDCGIDGFCSLNQEDTDGDGIGDACECEVDADCDDGLYCTDSETCVSNTCAPGISPCDDLDPCTTDPCDEDNDICLDKGCVAISPADPCCSDIICEGTEFCVAKVTLKPGDIAVTPGEIVQKSVCLDNPTDLVGGIQFDLCEYDPAGDPIDCMSCIDCELTVRSILFDCAVNELANGCCRVILFSKHPAGVINPGLCDMVTVFEFHQDQDCLGICITQIPEDIVAADNAGFQLPANGLPGEVCFCDDGIYCNGAEISVDGACQPGTNPCPDDGLYCNGDELCDEVNDVCTHTGDPCDDGNECTDDICNAGGSCTNVCNAASPAQACCSDPACSAEEVCASGGVIHIGDFWANCGDVGIKIPICLENLSVPIGGFQMDLCESIDDCLECVDCELTERTTVFDCVVNELSNGCCRVILFSKHPGGLINPGECDIVTIVYELKDEPECCDTCIEIKGENIILSDEFGYDILGVIGETGEICPFNCGDIEPGASEMTNQCTLSPDDCTGDGDCPSIGSCMWVGNPCTGTGPDNPDCPVSGWCMSENTCDNQPHMDCGDGDVDIFDILLEVAFALGTETPDQCQQGSRSNVPTGTPPYCIAPNEGTCSSGGGAFSCLVDSDCPESFMRCQNTINILDIMVIIDMALDKQDCCSYYYGGRIY